MRTRSEILKRSNQTRWPARRQNHESARTAWGKFSRLRSDCLSRGHGRAARHTAFASFIAGTLGVIQKSPPPAAPVVLTLVLTPLMETALQQLRQMSHGSFAISFRARLARPWSSSVSRPSFCRPSARYPSGCARRASAKDSRMKNARSAQLGQPVGQRA